MTRLVFENCAKAFHQSITLIKISTIPSYKKQHVHQRHICGEYQHQAPSYPYQIQQTFCHCEEYPNPHPKHPVNHYNYSICPLIEQKSQQIALHMIDYLKSTKNTVSCCSLNKTNIKESTEWPPGISRFN